MWTFIEKTFEIMPTANSFVSVNVNAPREVAREQKFDIEVTVQNQTNRNEDTVQVWIEPKDSASERLILYWATLLNDSSTNEQYKTQESVSLQGKKAETVRFKGLNIPSAVVLDADFYEYQIVVYSKSGQDRPIFIPCQLKVQPSLVQESRKHQFHLSEVMDSEYPLELEVDPQTGCTEHCIEIRVENIFHRVDKLRIACDFNRSWHRIESADGGNSINVNPRRVGSVRLFLTLPQNASSDVVYSPTLRMFSDIKEDQEVCRQIIYFKVKPFYGLDNEGVVVKFVEPRLRLPRRREEKEDQTEVQGEQDGKQTTKLLKRLQESLDWGRFNLLLDNHSNRRRYVMLRVEFSPEFSCKYYVLDDQKNLLNETIIELTPGESKPLQLWVNPKAAIPLGWIRPRWQEREYEVSLRLKNANPRSSLSDQTWKTLPLSSQEESATIVLKPTPSGLLFLLVALLVLGAGAVALWLAWHMWRLPPTPTLDSFEFSEESLDEDEGEMFLGNNGVNGNGERQNGMFLTWRVENAEQVQAFRLLSQDTLGQQEQQRFRVPDSLAQGSNQEVFEPIIMNGVICQPVLSEGREEEESQTLDCHYDLAGLDVTRDYSFRLEVFPKPAESWFGVRKRGSQEPVAVAETQTLTFDAPAIEALRLEYQFTEIQDQVDLTWDLSYGEQVALVTVTMLDEQGQTTVYRYGADNGALLGEDEGTRLVCQERQGQTGDSFIRRQGSGEDAAADPSWLSCRWSLESLLDSGLYRFKVAVFTEQNLREAVDERETQETVSLSDPQLRGFRTTGTNYEVGEPVRVSWAIDHPQRLDRLELTLQDGEGQHLEELPPGLFPHTPEAMLQHEDCRTEETGEMLQLLCEGVELVGLPIGRYLFEAGLLLRNGGEEPMRRQSRPVTVEPLRLPAEGGRPGRDSLFDEDRFQLRINGKLVEESPQVFRFALDEGGTPRELEIAWQVVAEGRDVTVELLPIPGEDVGLSGAFRYPLREAPQDLRLMLRVTNELGEEASRVAVIQTYRSQGQTGRSGETPGVRPGGEGEPLPPSQPLQVPPQVD